MIMLTEYIKPPGISSLGTMKLMNQGNKLLGSFKALYRDLGCKMGLNRA